MQCEIPKAPTISVYKLFLFTFSLEGSVNSKQNDFKQFKWFNFCLLNCWQELILHCSIVAQTSGIITWVCSGWLIAPKIYLNMCTHPIRRFMVQLTLSLRRLLFIQHP